MRRASLAIALALGLAVALSARGAKSKETGPPDQPAPDAGDDTGAGGGGVPPDPDFPAGMFSATVVGIPGNEFVRVSAAPFVATYRTFVRSRAPGPASWVFWLSTAQASTFGVAPTMPATSAPFLTTFFANGKNLAGQESNAGFSASYDMLVAPQMFASDRPITKRLCFLGDSITQGIGSTRDMYSYWVAKIADGLG